MTNDEKNLDQQRRELVEECLAGDGKFQKQVTDLGFKCSLDRRLPSCEWQKPGIVYHPESGRANEKLYFCNYPGASALQDGTPQQESESQTPDEESQTFPRLWQRSRAVREMLDKTGYGL